MSLGRRGPEEGPGRTLATRTRGTRCRITPRECVEFCVPPPPTLASGFCPSKFIVEIRKRHLCRSDSL